MNEVISKINNKYGYGFLYQVKDGDPNVKNCGAFTRNPSITPEEILNSVLWMIRHL